MPKKAVGNNFIEKVRLPTFMGQPDMQGRLCPLKAKLTKAGEPQPFYKHHNGTLFIGDSLRWLESLQPASIDLVFADPPYNLGKADWDLFESHDQYIEWSTEWIALASRALKDHGSLYVCGFSEILADIRRPAAKFFAQCKWLVWYYKNKANLANDWGRSHESILHFRKSKSAKLNVDAVRIPYSNHTLKYPEHPQAESSQYGKGAKRQEVWQPHSGGAKPKDVFEIPVTSNGMAEKTPHPTQKPEELLRRTILASSNEGDIVIDPFSGSGTTLVCAEQLKRRWSGCDLNEEYCTWAVARLEHIPHRSVSAWIELDQATARRRESIR